MPIITPEYNLYNWSDLNFPTIEPSLKLDFANARALDPRITFTRASTGTYVGRDGLIKTAGEDEARFDHDPTTGESLGLLIEESRTNLLPESEDLTSGLITKLAITTSNDTSVIAPDGTAGATRVIQNNTTAQHLIGDTASGLTLGGNYALSCFVKAGTTDLVWFSVNSYLNWVNDWNFFINLTTGNVYWGSGNISNANLKVEEYPNGWWKLSMVAQQEPAGGGAGGLWLGHADPNGTQSTNFTGDGSTYFYAWGFQMEAGSFPTSYIPTSGSTVTRAADIAKITGTNFTDFYNQTESTIFVHYKLDKDNYLETPAGVDVVSFRASGNTHGYDIRVVTDTSTPVLDVHGVSNSVTQYDVSGLNLSSGFEDYLVAKAFKLNDMAVSFNGGALQTDSSLIVYEWDKLVIGLVPRRAHYKSVKYYNKRLTNAQLQSLTRQ